VRLEALIALTVQIRGSQNRDCGDCCEIRGYENGDYGNYCEIRGSHEGDYEDYRLQGYDVLV
jgi:hypothetical protein